MLPAYDNGAVVSGLARLLVIPHRSAVPAPVRRISTSSDAEIVTSVRPEVPAAVVTVPVLSPADETPWAANGPGIPRRSMSRITCVLGGTNRRTVLEGSFRARVLAGSPVTAWKF